ncbi:M23 family metallopeptidase [Hyunsoonleella pacifica]|uniref:M23 family metallopeptidase n=1 Tax=Hyunsoonleella pacifica TaxID=1080224 RepID=A0A4Q9FUH7_9FLAO|nr:M23 family metallopeptidase [Hyunsoonleella pacifica]TBN17872.1 M23 family metallopeptidase [Hyunsoonleella pacifica]GGD08173.1 peptidase M23 [Hyunsoonleella pacifica]
MRILLALILLLSLPIGAQNIYPQDYFSNPLDIPLVLSGTFAELRSNHFHSGIDIKTQQRTGLKVKASADGYVSRIKISHYGYGKALYITHKNGYTTVYAHLKSFAPEIENYIKAKQYQKESYEIELFPKNDELLVEKNSLIAYSGNSGGSGGPHLHFEIRDNAERPINPMLFGIEIKDSKLPTVTSIYAYPLDDSSSVKNSNSKQNLRLIPLKNGDYTVENIEAFGKIGFGITTWDRQDLAVNKNGVYNIQTFSNGSKNFELDFKRFTFDETKHINQLIDYKQFKTSKQRVQKLFRENNPLSIYKDLYKEGVLTIEDSTYVVYKIKISDYKNNTAWVAIPIKGQKSKTVKTKSKATTPYYIYANKSTTLKENNISIAIYPDTFYQDFYMDFSVRGDTLTLHKDITPLKKNLKISYNIDKYTSGDKNKLFIVRLSGYKKTPYYSFTKREGDTLLSYTKRLGTYTLAYDNEKPTIVPVNFKKGQWLSKYRFLKLKINDEISGISNYRATVNGKWILMEYDYKTKILTHDFNDGIITDTKNNLKVIVTDNVGNSSTFETTFYRK